MKRMIDLIIWLLLILVTETYTQTFFSSEPLAHTYSIVARDPETGEMGVAVQSHWFSVGSIVAWGEAGVGVIATQSFVNPAYGPQGLAMLRNGITPDEVVAYMTSIDEGKDVRQVAVLSVDGKVAAHTGNKCIPDAGHIVGENYSVQANLMLNDKVWKTMAETFENIKAPLAERLIASLEAAQKVGGDIRGQQSASLLIVRGESTGKVWEDRLIDLRVEDHTEPVAELKRLLKVHRAYQHMNNGDLAVEKGEMKLAMEEYKSAENMFPENAEMKFWHAVTLANNGMLNESLPLFTNVFRKNENWRILTPRLRPIGLLNISESELKMILDLK